MNERYQAPTDWFVEGEIYDVVKAKLADGSVAPLAHVDPGCVLHPDACAEAARMMAAAPKVLAALRDVPLPSSNGTAFEFYERFYKWFKGVWERAIAEAEGRAQPTKL